MGLVRHAIVEYVHPEHVGNKNMSLTFDHHITLSVFLSAAQERDSH